MSCAVFTALAWYVAKTNQPNDWVANSLVAVAALCFLAAAYGAWSDQRDRVTELESRLLIHAPQFEFTVGATLWSYDAEANLTLFFIMAEIMNRGHPSIARYWRAVYKIGESEEAMTSFFLRTPYTITMGNEKIIFHNEDLLNVKTDQDAVERGGATNGRLLFTLPGDRTAQLKTSQFRIELTCCDYQGTPYTAAYAPSSAPLPKLLTFAREKAAIVPAAETSTVIEPGVSRTWPVDDPRTHR